MVPTNPVVWPRKNVSIALFFFVVFFLFVPASPQEDGFYLSGTIPDRDSQTSQYLIDLSNFYTAPLDNDWLVSIDVNLQTLPKGIQTFDGVQWDVRGIVQLAGTSLLGASTLSAEEKAKQYPQGRWGISVGLKAEKVYFLHASSWGAQNLQKVGEYVIHYANGDTLSVPLRYNEALIDWWAGATAKPTNADIAWHGAHAKSEISLFKYTWVNPSPEKAIAAMDFVSSMSSASPFCIAITCDPGSANIVRTAVRTAVGSAHVAPVRLFDVNGRVIRKYSAAAPFTVDKNLPCGVYFLETRSLNTTVVKPLTITH